MSGITIPSKDGLAYNFDPTDLSTTPGGTIYGTTPGGTRIVYDRNALLFIRNSPLSKTPPTGMPVIPGVTAPADAPPEPTLREQQHLYSHEKPLLDEDSMFAME